MKVINSKQELDDIIASGKTYIQFSANWCGPCRMMSPIVENMETDYPDINFVKIDGGKEQARIKNHFKQLGEKMNKHLITKEMERLGIKASSEELESQEMLDRIHFLREVKKQIEDEIHTLDRKLGKKMLDLQRRKNGSYK